MDIYNFRVFIIVFLYQYMNIYVYQNINIVDLFYKIKVYDCRVLNICM